MQQNNQVKTGGRQGKRLVIIISGVLPLIIGIFFTALDARHTVHQQQVTAANTLLSQAERMSDSAWDISAADARCGAHPGR